MQARPRIVLSTTDAERLERLLETLDDAKVPGRAELAAELDRADVVDAKDVPANVVTMNSTVRFRIESSSEEFCLRLVYPKDAHDSGTISILAPVGSALLGLTENDEIEWPKPGGGSLRVRIVEIIYQPERAGDFHR
ncbi:nucleoside diphosphate kinase regulator [Thiocapsa imhoffii]|uniref:Nucleoside diphosphate kinase regulator n=1 Tax=Thiocapsa imhoffii TaxID=382777 RepID=A0A9X0WFL5_9GAMM|nr:nucleoside diphosphate kinase regulator [Thiocapsa imhoffii]MBK1643799.1 nucleoside diphosphate kinase regulator [Thiocapsa imhoffii]